MHCRQSIFTIRVRAASCFVLLALLAFCRTTAQRPLRNSLTASFSGMSYLDHGQYIGPDFTYIFQINPWLRVQAEMEHYSAYQFVSDAFAGGPLTTYQGSAHIGHRIKKIGLYAKIGAGDFHPLVFSSATNQGVYYGPRNSPLLYVGGIAELNISRRWFSYYDIGDEHVWFGPYYQYVFAQPTYVDPKSKDNFRAAAGIGLRF